MIQVSKQSDQSTADLASEQPTGLSQHQPSIWVWLVLLGGSVLLHLPLLGWLGAIILPGSAAVTVAIDLVELPDDPALSPNQPQQSSPSTSQNTGSQAESRVTSQAQTSLPQLAPALVQQPEVAAQLRPAPVPNRQFAAVISAAVAPVSPDSQPAPAPQASLPAVPAPSPQVEPITKPASGSRIQPNSEPVAAASPARSPTAQPITQPVTQPITQPLVEQSPTVSQPTVSQPIMSQPIAPPVPNLLPSPDNSQSDEQLGTAMLDATLVPNYLTARLVAASPPDLPDLPPLEQAAQPQPDVQRFLTNSQLPPCDVTPEAVFFLGKTVALRVTTDAAGQVVQTATEVSSQNLAYDELAACLVQNWSFKPAIVRGKPARSDGLIIQIKIDHS